MYFLSATQARTRRANQSQLRAGIGLALLAMTLGAQLIWTLTSY